MSERMTDLIRIEILKRMMLEHSEITGYVPYEWAKEYMDLIQKLRD